MRDCSFHILILRKYWRSFRTASATASPLRTMSPRLADLSGPPYELLDAVEGLEVAKIEIRKARDLTDPLDLMRGNFPYLQ